MWSGHSRSRVRLLYLLLSASRCSGVEVSPAHGLTPRDEAGYELAVAAVWDPETLPELTFFQGELECELRQVESSEQHESPAAGEQRGTQDQAQVRVIQGVAHVPIRSLYHEPLRNIVLLSHSSRWKQGSGE